MSLASISKLLNGSDQDLLRSLDLILQSLQSPDVYQTEDQNIHKFKVRVSSLLGSKNATQRYIGTEIASTALENNWDILQSHGIPWSKSFLHIIETPGNNSAINVQSAIKALSSLFSLTVGKPDLARTIATPILPNYIKALLKHCKDGESLVFNDCLLALNSVLSQQSTTFRPHAKNYHELIIGTINRFIDEGKPASLDLEALAEAFVSLHKAATKGSEPLEWRSALISVISETNAHIHQSEPQPEFLFSLALYNQSVVKYLDKFTVLLTLLRGFLSVPTKTAVQVPLHQLMALIKTLLTHVQTQTKLGYSTVIISELRKSVVVLADTVGESLLPFVEDLMFDIQSVITSSTLQNDEAKLELIKMTLCIYTKVCKSVSRATADSANNIISTALDLLEMPDHAQTSKSPDYLQKPYLFSRKRTHDFLGCINKFLATMLLVYPNMVLPLRSRIDRHFLLTKYIPGIEASAVLPGAAKYSIIPMAASLKPGSLVLEALVHPRLPLSQGPSVGFQQQWNEKGDQSEDQSENQNNKNNERPNNQGMSAEGTRNGTKNGIFGNEAPEKRTLEELSTSSIQAQVPKKTATEQQPAEEPELIMESMRSVKKAKYEPTDVHVNVNQSTNTEVSPEDASQPTELPKIPSIMSTSSSTIKSQTIISHTEYTEEDDDIDMGSDIEIPAICVADSDEEEED